MTHRLKSAVESIQNFETFWGECAPPPRKDFDKLLVEKVSRAVGEASDFSIVLHPESSDSSSARVRLSGQCRRSGEMCRLYGDIVWLVRARIFRCKIDAYEMEGEYEKGSVSEFIERIKNINERGDVVLEGQIFNACARVDSDSADFKQAFPEVFLFFERFPEEDFGAPCILVPMLEKHSGYEMDLEMSLKRKPNVNAIVLAGRLLAKLYRKRDRRYLYWNTLLEELLLDTRVTDVQREQIESFLVND